MLRQMRYRPGVRLAIAAALVVVGCADDHGPRLTSVDPTSAPAGAQIVLHGERLCGDDASCDTAVGEIAIGLSPPTVRLVVIEYQDTAATVMIPTSVEVGPTAIVMVVNERSSNAIDFEVLPPSAP